MRCVTGLPLIFAEEIGHLSGAEPELTAPAPGAVPANLDSLIAKAKAEYPGEMPLFLGWYPDEPIVYVNLGPSADTPPSRSEEHTSELQSLMRISYAVFCLKKKNTHHNNKSPTTRPAT